jgi:hypothetical protein
MVPPELRSTFPCPGSSLFATIFTTVAPPLVSPALFLSTWPRFLPGSMTSLTLRLRSVTSEAYSPGQQPSLMSPPPIRLLCFGPPLSTPFTSPPPFLQIIGTHTLTRKSSHLLPIPQPRSLHAHISTLTLSKPTFSTGGRPVEDINYKHPSSSRLQCNLANHRTERRE